MRTVSFAILILAGLACGLLRAQETDGFSLIETDEEAGMVYSLSFTEADYDSGFFYQVHVYGQMWEGYGRLQAQSCYIEMGGSQAACGFDFVLGPDYEYVLKTTHSLTVYFRHYEVDPYCYNCWMWWDAFGFSQSDTPCGRDGAGDPTPCVPGWQVTVWAWLAENASELIAEDVALGETGDHALSPMPVLHVQNNGSDLSSGGTVYITAGSASSQPHMPALTAYLTSSAGDLTGNTTWKITVEYIGAGRSDSDWYPSSSGRSLSSSSTWDIRSDFGGDLRGGTATIKYTYGTQPERSFGLQIRGNNPSEADAKTFLGSTPWFLTRMARQESAITQFDPQNDLLPKTHQDSPYWGFGMMQVTNPPATRQQIWHWWDNVAAGVLVLFQKDSQLSGAWAGRIQDWNTWNRDHQGQEVGPPTFGSDGGCQFVWKDGDYGTATQKSFRDASWMKRYNGLGTEGKDYLIWENRPPFDIDPRWVRTEWATRPNNGGVAYYARDVCNQNP